ncbi:tripartite tricarboxylate transporter TctB family protein [Martelella soudanensis]|uniref:tripartite tricarboxylate transporter TctB family protein n=1 Tax=unclassified Martelella TaxID=2629616 RepID=UPI0015DDDB87|nr:MULTISPECIES: tripartite tricarboxylate transporter TctB family protein [unclassified Martelella]
MRFRTACAEWLAAAVCLGVAGLVFQQAATDLTEQGIASGGPYDNAASYPKTIAACLIVLVILQLGFQAVARGSGLMREDRDIPLRALLRPAAVLAVLVIYVFVLKTLGYYISTLAMMAGIMVLCGLRNWIAIATVTFALTFGLAWIFEVVLLVTMPGGIFDLHMPW